jgi:hypothetical protein
MAGDNVAQRCSWREFFWIFLFFILKKVLMIQNQLDGINQDFNPEIAADSMVASPAYVSEDVMNKTKEKGSPWSCCVKVHVL